MTNNKPRKYLFVIEWNDPSISTNNKGVLFYSVCPRDGMMPEEFEKFMKEKAFPAVDDISTRAIRYKAKYLLVDAEDEELDALDNDPVRNLINENLADRHLVDSFLPLRIQNKKADLRQFYYRWPRQMKRFTRSGSLKKRFVKWY